MYIPTLKVSLKAQLRVVPRRTFFNLPGKNEVQTFTVSKTMFCKPQLMFDVVSNVDEYGKFIPFVETSYITSRDPSGNPSNAGIQIGWKNVDEKFDCKLHCVPHSKVIAESLTHTLFDKLHTEWNIAPSKNENRCEVDLTLQYKFKNPMYNAISSMFSDQVTAIMIDAFEKRVQQLQKR